MQCQEYSNAFAGMLDVQQIFGRAGRPQFEDEGLGIIITQHAQLAHYLGMLTHQTPIESKFTDPLVDNLNAEIVLGKPDYTADAQAGLSAYLFANDQSWRDLTGILFAWLSRRQCTTSKRLCSFLQRPSISLTLHRLAC